MLSFVDFLHETLSNNPGRMSTEPKTSPLHLKNTGPKPGFSKVRLKRTKIVSSNQQQIDSLNKKIGKAKSGLEASMLQRQLRSTAISDMKDQAIRNKMAARKIKKYK